MPSQQKINYSLRPAKNVVRKLLAECFLHLQDEFEIASYRYIGMGSLWFSDHTLFHRVLRISDMVSIEGDPETAKRTEFNRPFGCIRVEEGESTGVLPDVVPRDQRALVWLDYTSGLEGPIFQDLPIVFDRVASGSIVLVTINAHHKQLVRPPNENGNRPPPNEVLGGLIDRAPQQISAVSTSRTGFPRYIAGVIFERMEHHVRLASGGALQFCPLINFFYEDGAPMITMGGMVADPTDAARLEETAIRENVEYVTERDQIDVLVPILTPKEKISLDRLLPSEAAPTRQEVEALGFSLHPDEIKGFHRYYRFYPVFTEMVG